MYKRVDTLRVSYILVDTLRRIDYGKNRKTNNPAMG